MTETLFSQSDSWLNLGISGAALFIVLIVIVLIFKQQNASVDKLCIRIDNLINSFSENNLKLTEVTLTNDHDQKELLRRLDDTNRLLQDTHKRVVRIDTRLYQKGEIKNGTEEQWTGAERRSNPGTSSEKIKEQIGTSVEQSVQV